MRLPALLVAAALVACRPGAPSTPADGAPRVSRAAVGDEFQLKPGEVAEVAGTGLRVTFRNVASDSRCPSAVQCPWAGDAAVELAIEQGGRTADTTLHTTLEPKAVEYGDGLSVALVSLAPYPVRGGDIPAGSYIATLKVARR